MKDSPITENQISEHLNTLSDRLQEAYKVVIENNRLSRTKQKEYYDQGTKLRQFQVGDMVYIKEMAVGKNQSSKFRLRWKGPFEVVKRLSDLTYLIRIKPNKEVVVNVNRLKLCRSVTVGKHLPRPSTRPSDKSIPLEQEHNPPDHTTEDCDTEQNLPIPRSQKVPLPLPAMTGRQPDEINDNQSDTDRSTDLNENTQDPPWSPSEHHKRSLRSSLSELEVSGTRPIEGRYNLRPRNVQGERPIPEPNHEPQMRNVDENKEEERNSETPVVEQFPEDRENERATREQLPYNLRHLPGRQLTRRN
jgi:hypothetical protein